MGFFFNATSSTLQSFPSRTSEFIDMSCPKGKESDSFSLLAFLLFQLISYPAPPLFQQQVWNFYDYLTKVSKKSFGNNLSWVSPLKSCGSNANTSSLQQRKKPLRREMTKWVLKPQRASEFFFFFLSPSLSFSHELNSSLFLILKKKGYPFALITF